MAVSFVLCFAQIATRPPTVAIFCNNPKLFGDNYKRYLDRKFREQVRFSVSMVDGTPAFE